MAQKYQVTAITMHDGEVSELRALGVPITTTNGVQDRTEFEVELSVQQLTAVRAHDAVIAVTEL